MPKNLESKKLEPKVFELRQYKDGQWQKFEDLITTEVSVGISWSAPDIPMQKAQLWAWPDFLEQVAVGHVLLEKFQGRPWLGNRRVTAKRCDQEGMPFIEVSLSLEDETRAKPQPPLWTAQELLLAMDSFIDEQGLWENTGCFHRAGIYCPKSKKLLHKVEDIARHNCIDRLTGWAALHEVSLGDKILLVSARLTQSLCAKALRAGFPILVSRSAVTTAAVGFAEKAGATLVGFARTKEGRFTVFTDSQNLLS